MQRISPVIIKNLLKDDKLADRVAQSNRKVYDGKYYPIKLKEWIRGMKKMFTLVEVPKEKKVYIGTFYLTEEADI